MPEMVLQLITVSYPKFYKITFTFLWKSYWSAVNNSQHVCELETSCWITSIPASAMRIWEYHIVPDDGSQCRSTDTQGGDIIRNHVYMAAIKSWHGSHMITMGLATFTQSFWSAWCVELIWIFDVEIGWTILTFPINQMIFKHNMDILDVQRQLILKGRNIV